MTQSIPAQPKDTFDKAARHQRLLELLEAEDAANGEVGCGRNLGKGLSGYLSTRGVALDDEQLKRLLREHLGHILMEPDFDSITTQIQRRLESLVGQSLDSSSSFAPLLNSTNVTEHIPTKDLRELFQPQLADFCSEDTLEHLIGLSHQIIHKAVLQPRHTWSKPIWVLRGETQIYIVQETGSEAAIAKVKTQHPQETEKLEVITVGGILAPDQVISLNTNLL
ncbi:hypothetical protein H6F88_10810 [Oculatella sp. FACHB-28]|uniref:DEK C-terminal domain-containing protein n=1 Tax=Oculatella sp. FACHB-28 TaxID=2692845 RepID=UPI001684B904|nr:DEK C-terminal domain-containing protein [Oculatella sp. FACHB-28]MBD2056498.1 hypothetical protein [Oculatella sp. FACHB-28]